MKHGIISLGETLVDFIPTDETNTIYQKSPGGAPANVAAGAARLGVRSSFIGKVGDDLLGSFLQETLNGYGVGTQQMQHAADVRTGVVFVTNAEDGERSFEFYNNPSADRFLEASEIDQADLASHKIFHFGSISMIGSPAKEATEAAVQLAKESGMIVSYDPNIRLPLWESEQQARETIPTMFGAADVLKLSAEELEFITGEKLIVEGVKQLQAYNIPLLIITMGADGCFVFTSEGYKQVPAMQVKAVDTTGAGDAFVSAMLYSLHEYKGDIRLLALKEAAKMAQFAAVSGALAASVKGAMTALPALAEVEKHLA